MKLDKAVLGVRGWFDVNEDPPSPRRLRSLGMNYFWEPGINVAECYCRCVAQHEAPAHECGCGLYGYYPNRVHIHPLLAFAARYMAYGAIAMWGKLELHLEGLRAEFAEIIALWPSEASKDHLNPVGEYYDVPVVEDKDAAQPYIEEWDLLIPSGLNWIAALAAAELVPPPEYWEGETP